MPQEGLKIPGGREGGTQFRTDFSLHYWGEKVPIKISSMVGVWVFSELLYKINNTRTKEKSSLSVSYQFFQNMWCTFC